MERIKNIKTCWHTVIIFKLWTRKKNKTKHWDIAWYNILPNRARWSFIFDNIRMMLLIIFVATALLGMQICFLVCPMTEAISDFGSWFCLTFLTRVFWTEWLALFLSISWRSSFWIMFFIIEFILWIPMGNI